MKKLVVMLVMLTGISNFSKAQSTHFDINPGNICTQVWVVLIAFDNSCNMVDISNPILCTPNTPINLTGTDFSNPSFWNLGSVPGGTWEFEQVKTFPVFACKFTTPPPYPSSSCPSGVWDGVMVGAPGSCSAAPTSDCYQLGNAGGTGCSGCSSTDQINVTMNSINDISIQP